MFYYSYKIEHDFGLAPNPFGKYCTLAICKPSIRNHKYLKIGDWIIGTGSVKLQTLHRLIFAMEVEEKVSFNQYWADPRFEYKKPVINGSLVQLYGDNIYHQNDDSREWIQENSAHSLETGLTNDENKKTDIGGKYILISTNFYYFGDKAIPIPNRFLEVCCEGRNMKTSSIPTQISNKFILWLKKNMSIGFQ